MWNTLKFWMGTSSANGTTTKNFDLEFFSGFCRVENLKNQLSCLHFGIVRVLNQVRRLKDSTFGFQVSNVILVIILIQTLQEFL